MSKPTSQVAEAVYSRSAKIGQTRIAAKRCVGEKNLFSEIVLKLSIYGGWVVLKSFSEVVLTILWPIILLIKLFCKVK